MEPKMNVVSTNPYIQVDVLADSFYRSGGKDCRLITFYLVYPRFIHDQLGTHRVFSRSSISYRAIGVKRLIKMIEDYPSHPALFGRANKRMKASESIDESVGQSFWLKAERQIIELALEAERIGLHPEVANRLFLTIGPMQTIVTTTELDNFFLLRAKETTKNKPQTEIQILARAIKEAYESSSPQELHLGDWHLPLITDFEKKILSTEYLKLISAARVARISYASSKRSYGRDRDESLAKTLMQDRHLGPFEHQATPAFEDTFFGNLRGWIQQRKEIPGESGVLID